MIGCKDGASAFHKRPLHIITFWTDGRVLPADSRQVEGRTSLPKSTMSNGLKEAKTEEKGKG